MGCWYSKCRGPKKAAKKEEAVEVKEVNTLPGGEGAAAADDGGAEELSNRTSIANENAILPNEDISAPSSSSPTKPNGIHIVVNTPASAAVRAPPGSGLVHMVGRRDESEAVAGVDETEGDEVGPLPSPRPKRPTLKRMATSELSDNFCEGEDGDGDDSSSHVSVEAIRRPGQDEARTQGTDSMIAESGSRVASSVRLREQALDEPANSETPVDKEEVGEVQRIEVHPCSSVEEQGDENAEVDENRLAVPEEVLPASPSSSSDEEGSLSSFGGEEEMEPIKEEPEEEEKEELEISRLRDELNNNDPGHGTAENHTIKSPSSGTSTEDIANIDTETNKSNLTRRRSLADSVHDLQHELEKELELRLGPDIDIGESPMNSTAGDSERGRERLENGAPAPVELSVTEGQEVKRTSCHVQIGGEGNK